MMSMSAHYPFVHVSGKPFEMGIQHGEQCRDRVRRFVQIIRAGAFEKGLDRDAIRSRTLAFLPLFERHVPRLVEEVRGLATGADIPFEDALLLQVRGEINVEDGDACTTFVLSGEATADGRILIGQNSDMQPVQEEVGIVLHIVPDRGPRILMWTFAGHLGYHGMNSAGVAHFANGLAGGPAWRRGLPHYPVKRAMLECATVAEALCVLDTHPVCSSGNYVLTGGCRTIEDVELTPAGYAKLGNGNRNFIAHTNHFLSDCFRSHETDSAATPDSFPRYDRIRGFLAENDGRITVDLMKRILSDHDTHPKSICRHTNQGDGIGKTVASLIAEPEAGRFHVSRGNPCCNDYTTYEV